MHHPEPTWPDTTRRGSDFSELYRRVAAAGLLKRRPVYYTALITGTLAAAALGTAVFLRLGSSWWQLAVAALMGIVFGQIGLVAHEIAHRAVFPTRRTSDLAGILLGNLGLGMSYGWWTSDHTHHHANPNRERHDPAADALFFARTPRQAAATRGLTRFLARHQRALFFPVLTLQGIGLGIIGFLTIVRRRVKHPVVEGALLALHYGLYGAALLLVLTPVQALCFFLLHEAVLGVYLGCLFAPNHKGMPMIEEDAPRLDFLRRQVLPSRNIPGGPALTWLFGGLNYQIEHHLFPYLPRPALRPASVIVREYCRELGIPYHGAGLRASFAEVLRDLRSISDTLGEAGSTPTAGTRK
ncbi:fatty acid desaturase family protein [Streptomyces yaizuensis]|uniref:Acyl-CoA desaturase n=1 Tax=Streptomyces yaizuensis TaxID=2989713 RepID=A0ABQ5NXF6_9ACTN|nr:acyl-CoA desaturase [Streptomyces sp. YSPA8]GLF95044.1 acyl-CoA desaturase [Streptomyces sp. YSPA8]